MKGATKAPFLPLSHGTTVSFVIVQKMERADILPAPRIVKVSLVLLTKLAQGRFPLGVSIMLVNGFL